MSLVRVEAQGRLICISHKKSHLSQCWYNANTKHGTTLVFEDLWVEITNSITSGTNRYRLDCENIRKSRKCMQCYEPENACLV